MQELLALLCNLLPSCPDARSALAATLPASASAATASTAKASGAGTAAAGAAGAAGSHSSLLQRLLALLSNDKSEQPTWHAANRALLHFSSTEDGAAVLVRPGGSYLADAQKLLRGYLARKEHGRLAGTLQVSV